MIDMMKLTANNVTAVAKDCICGEKSVGAIKVDGLVSAYVFNKKKLDEHEKDIIDMLDQLPDGFKKSKGGGWSFMMACDDKDGLQWGEHSHIEALVCLGIAVGKASISPRMMWNAWGGMPYVTVNL